MEIDNFSDFTRVVIIDDSEIDGTGIREALDSVQVPSLFYNVDMIRDVKVKNCTNIRLVFLDLIFSDSASGSSSPEQNAGNALSKLSRVVGKTGFYILVVWSSNIGEDVEVVFRQQMDRQNEFAKPYIIIPLQKDECKNGGGEYDPALIIGKINDNLHNIPSLRVFWEWEKLANNSISEIAGSVTSQKSHEDLSRAINSLSEAYAGKCKPDTVPKNALMAFNEIFRSTVSQQIVSNDFGNLYEQIEAGKLDKEEKSRLNTVLMFNPDTVIGPGSIYKITGQSTEEKEEFIKAILDQNDETTLGDTYGKIIPISVDVTPLCNAAQSNGKHVYYLDGLLYPEKYKKDNGYEKEITVSKRHKPYCYTLEKMFWDNDCSYKMSFNLKLFHSKFSNNFISMDKKIRDNLIIDLQHQISSYISRPGHVLL